MFRTTKAPASIGPSSKIPASPSSGLGVIEGLTLNDAAFTVNEANARAAGVLIGAYHYAHPDTHLGLAGADEEAAHFWSIASNYITGSGTYLMPVLDFEATVTNVSPPYTQATLSAWVNEWCQDIVNYGAANGIVVKPVVYTFVSYANRLSGFGPDEHQ